MILALPVPLLTTGCISVMSATQLQIAHLKRDELEYELRFRGVDPTVMTVESMRSSLRSLVRLERAHSAPSYTKYVFDAVADVAAITAKLTELEALVTEVGTGNQAARDRCCSRLLHLMGRVDGIPIKGGEDVPTKKRGEWIARVSSLLTELRSHSGTPELNLSVSLGDGGSSSGGESVSEEEPDGEPRGAACLRRIPVYKWGVHFTGDLATLSVMDFLERVSELRRARGYSETELYHSSLDLFQGKALVWYRSAIRKCKTWPELAELLKQHYLPPDYRSRLFQEILNRTQGPHEPIVEYLSCIQALLSRYGKISKEVHLDIVRRNLAPFYTMQLPPVNTMEDLERECLQLETKKYRADHYRAPPRRGQGCVEPELACVTTALDEVSVGPSAVRPQRDMSVVRCYRCRQFGHYARDCTGRDVRAGNSGRGTPRVDDRSPR